MKLNNFGFGSGGGGGAAGDISGSGTAPKMPKFTAEKTIADSQVSDNGTTVFIGASATTASALFELNSTTQGMLFPRMTTTQRDAISVGASANSLLLYNTTTSRYQYYLNGTGWVTIPTSTDIPAAPTTLYSGDGSLSSNRTVTMAGNTLAFSGNLTTFRGAGSTSGTSTLLVQNAGSTDLFRVRNDGAVISYNGYWQGTDKILYINPGASTGNLFVGENAGNSSSGNNNVGLGANSLLNSTAENNVAIGAFALYTNTSGSPNVAIGTSSMFYNTTGIYNVAIGVSSLQANTTGQQNMAIGADSLYANTIGSYNAAVGVGAMFKNVDGQGNTAIGANAMNENTSGGSNTAIGRQSGYYMTSGHENTLIGMNAGFNGASRLTTGYYNTIVGSSASVTNGGAYGNSILGYGALADGNYNVVLGYNTSAPTGNNQFVIGNATQTVGTITTEAVTPDATWTIWINGSQYKVALEAIP